MNPALALDVLEIDFGKGWRDYLQSDEMNTIWQKAHDKLTKKHAAKGKAVSDGELRKGYFSELSQGVGRGRCGVSHIGTLIKGENAR